MSSECSLPVGGFGFSHEQIEAAVRERRLLTMEMEFSRVCNFGCPYCYVAGGPGEPLTFEEAQSVLRQARDLGARKIIVLGGEPMLYPLIRESCTFIRSLGMEVEMFSNGTNLTVENARFLFEHGVAVVLKLNSRQPAVQNRLAGRADAFDIIQGALANLRSVGYPAPGKRLAASTVICTANLDELPELWRWLRRAGIEPYVEMITPQGRARRNEWLAVSPARVHQLFQELAAIDRAEFGFDWEPQPPLVGNQCLRHRFSCVVTASGDVLPCVGVSIPVGNVRQEPLKTILANSEVVEDLRRFPETIKAPCGECEKAASCYGCRGAAYQLTGDYLASDPLCWRNTEARIEHLPCDVRPYLPHRPPICLVDTLVSVGERTARLDLCVPAQGVFVNPDGTLDEAAYLEVIAQAVAGLHGFRTPERRRGQHRGLLLGVNQLTVSGVARAGDRLSVELRKIARLDEFGVVEGTVTRNGELLARGEVKVWQSSSGDARVTP